MNHETFEQRDRRQNPAQWAIHDHMMAKLRRPSTVERWIDGGKEYMRCSGCGKIVRLNKPIFGSLHLCS